MGPDGDSDRTRRRRQRLHEELVDEMVPVPRRGAVGQLLLEEIDHARHPPVHEGHVATYGVLVGDGALSPLTTGTQQADQVPLADVPLPAARRLADGRGSFLVRRTDGSVSLACFAHSIEYEANIVGLATRQGANVVQRTPRGHVKVITPDTVVVWDGVRWLQKPHARVFRPLVARLVPDVDRAVVDGLLELAVHWFSPAFRGATLVWSMHRPVARLTGVDPQGQVPGPPLQVTCREHFSALLSLHGQLDGATLVEPDGTCAAYGATLVPSREAVETVPPHRGTRHTSARRYSYDHPGSVVVVVSEDGPVSVFLDGARIVLASSDPARAVPDDQGALADGAEERHVRCANCHRLLVVDLPRGRTDPRSPLTCPVCDEPAGAVATGATARGVQTSGDQRRTDTPARGSSPPGEGS